MKEHVDEFGPEKVVFVHDQKTGMCGVTVIHNTARGLGKGGIRFASDITVPEVIQLARTMTLKNAMADLPLGGAKSGIMNDPRAPNKEEIVRAFARKIGHLFEKEYVGAPDMNTGQQEMAWIVDEVQNKAAVTGKPESIGGIPHEWGTTGYGVGIATLHALDYMGFDLDKGVYCAIEGFGNVGQFAMKLLSERGVKVVAVSDSKGMIYDPDGLDYEELVKTKKEKGSVGAHSEGKQLDNKSLYSLPVDILIPGARLNVITSENYQTVKAKLIVEAANHPIPYDIEKKLSDAGKIVVPDIVANAGGVISSYCEMIGKSLRSEVFKEVETRITKNMKLLFEGYKPKSALDLRQKAETIAKNRVREAMTVRGWLKDGKH